MPSTESPCLISDRGFLFPYFSCFLVVNGAFYVLGLEQIDAS
ncbi:hypothetical protein ACD591_16210 [Rufibacter glacialis]|uniref:Uncharacterized protein n=1 Tax=Rufibacter glacialis TaxID=1259555 RepID=A0ABV4RI71_9BACT|nr:hypothetical protein [Rufibacter glacialis]